MQQVCEPGRSRRYGGSAWLVLAVVCALALFHPIRAAAQCCACPCAGANFCVDDVSGPVACATLCNDAGCPNFAFQDGDSCTGGCGGQPDFPTATPTGTAAATATDTPTHTETPEPTATETGAATPSATDTHTAGATPTDTPTLPAGTATATVTSTPTSNPLDTATATATSTPTSNPLDTATVTPTLTPTETSPNVVHVDVGTAVGQPGSVVGFAAMIDAEQAVTSLQVCLQYAAQTPIHADVSNAPDCTAGASVSALFSFQPAGCSPGSTCTGVCADLSGAPDFPVSGTIFTCRVAIAANAAVGTYPLTCSVDAQSPGPPVVASCTDGEVIVQTNLPGDCNGDGMVTISELITGVNIALGNFPVTACPAFDTDHDGQVSIAELIAAVNVALTQ